MTTFDFIKPIGTLNSSIGELAIFDLTLSNQNEIYKAFKNDLEKVDQSQFMKVFVGQTCHKRESLDEKLSKPKGTSLSENEISQLHSEDFENIAKLYLEKNEYLFKESQTITSKDSKNNDVISLKYGDVIHPKSEVENFQEYLLRLMVLEKKKNDELVRQTINKFTDFSKGLQNSIKQNLTIGEQLSKAIKSFQAVNIPKVEPIFVKKSERDFSKLVTPRPDLQLITMKEVSSQIDSISGKLESIAGISAEYVQYTIEANNIQTKIAEEVKKSSDTATKFAKVNVRVSVIVLIVTILSFIFGIFTMLNSNKSNMRMVNEIVNRFDTLNKNISNSNKYNQDYKNQIQEIKFQLDLLKLENKKLQDNPKKTKN